MTSAPGTGSADAGPLLDRNAARRDLVHSVITFGLVTGIAARPAPV